MKIITTCLFLIISHLSCLSQTLTQTYNEPKAGEVESYYYLDTAGYATGMPVSITGTNCVWDFTKLIVKPPVSKTNYADTANVPAAAGYTGCTFVQQSSGFNTFMKSVTTPTTQTEVLGLELGPANLKFSNTAIIIKYPASYGLNYTDNIAGTASGQVSGSVSGSVTTKIDGQGVLILPLNVTYSNVIRLKSVQTVTLTNGFPIATFKQTFYNYYHPSFKFPVLSLNYSSVAFVLGTPTITSFVYGSTNFFIVGLSEVRLNEALTVFPVPFSGPLTVTLENPGSEVVTAGLYAITGEKLLEKDLGTATLVSEDISIPVNPGIYLLCIKRGESKVWRRIIKE
jgi:hypothetical protein